MGKVIKDIFENDFIISHPTHNVQGQTAHIHDDIEIYFHIKGGRSCLIDNNIYNLSPFDLILFKPNQIHKFMSIEDHIYERYIILSKVNFLSEVQEDNEIIQLFNQVKLSNKELISLSNENRDKLLSLLDEYFNIDGKCFKTLLKAKFIEIMVFTLTLFCNTSNINLPFSTDTRILKILSYINNHFREISLDNIAYEFNISKTYLCGFFKKKTGITINSYILNKKIVYSKRLLLDGYNVTECCDEAGFHDYSNFIRVFKKQVGLSPKKFQLKNEFNKIEL